MTYNTLRTGFTLIELMIVVTIIGVISAIVLANHGLYRGNTVLDNLGYDIALSIRKAQVYGIATARATGNNFSTGYGMHFVANTTQYRMFADTITHNGIYETGEDVAQSPFTLSGGYSIVKLCTPAGTDPATCTSRPNMDVFFVRPDPDAYITQGNESLTFDGNGQVVGNSPNSNARVVVSAANGQLVSIIIDQNGTVYVSR